MTKVEHHVLYRFFNADEELLYVGITNNPASRFNSHFYAKRWTSEIVRATMEHFATSGELVVAEQTAIRTEKPKYNKTHSVTSPEPEIHVDRPRKRKYVSVTGMHANRFRAPDAIASDEPDPFEADIAQGLAAQRQLLWLRMKLRESRGF